jgi:hypothetical protein
MKLKTHNMAHKQRTPFTLKSGNKTSFKAMGSSPMQIRFASPEAGAILPQNSGINGGGYGPRPAPQTPEKMKAQEEAQKKMMMQRQATEMMKAGEEAQKKMMMQRQATATPISQQYDGTKPLASKSQTPEMMKQRSRGDYENFANKVSGGKLPLGGQVTATQQGPNTMMNAQAPALTPEQKFALSSTSVRTPVGASRPPAQANTPRVAVQSAPRPDLSGGPRQPMGRPMGAPRQPMGGLGQPMGGPGFGGPGQLPPNKGRRKPGMGSGMGRARRATGLARRAKRAAGQVRRVRRSKG